MARVLVTGALGNIGQFVVAELLRKGHSVLALDLENPSTRIAAKKFANQPVTIVWGDLRDKNNLGVALGEADAVIHMAAIIPPLSETNKALATEINVNATRQLIELMVASPKAKRLVLASSMGIYGKNQSVRNRPLQVSDPASPDDHYGESKVQAEALVKTSSLQWTILRLTASPPVNLSSARSHKGNNPFDFHPDARVEIVHPADAGAAFAHAIDVNESIGKIFFVGGGESCRMKHAELTNKTFQAAGLSAVSRDVFKDSGKIEMYGDWVETAEGQTLLNYQNHSAEDFYRDFKASFGLAFYLVKLIGPLATWFMVRQNGYKK